MRNVRPPEIGVIPEELDQMEIYIDADACPVKDEVYRVAKRYEAKVLRRRQRGDLRPGQSLDRAGGRPGRDWTSRTTGSPSGSRPKIWRSPTDIPLADRCLKRGATVLGPRGIPFTDESIGEALATRELLDTLRQSGMMGTGPPPFGPKDRSRFLAKLDEAIQAIRRRRK